MRLRYSLLQLTRLNPAILATTQLIFDEARHNDYSEFTPEFPFYLPIARHYIPLRGLQRIMIFFGRAQGAIPLVYFSRQLGWDVTVVDDRPAYACPERFPGVDRVMTLAAGSPAPLTDGRHFCPSGGASDRCREIAITLATSEPPRRPTNHRPIGT